jgi:hypothetical protein
MQIDKLERLVEKLDKHGELLAGIAEQNKTIFNEVSGIKKQLFGNGQEGICVTLTKHKAYFRITSVILSIIITALVGKLFNLI